MVDHKRMQVFLGAGLVAFAAGFGPMAAADILGETDSCLSGKLQRAELQQLEQSAAMDEATGKDLRNFPRDRVVDYLHMLLEMRFENLNDMRFSATETLRMKPIGKATQAITLDAVGLDITSLTYAGSAVEYYNDGEELTIRFDPPLALGKEHEIIIEYICDHPYAGLFFTPASADVPDYTAEVHTQGQAITSRHWFACHDSPNERMSTELIVDVPSGFSVSSNGRLVSQSDNGDRAIWHYLQGKSHVSYLVSLVIGKFDIVEIPHSRLPMQVWVPQGLGDKVMQTYGRTGEMIDLFEDRFGIAYPWARYDQVLAKNFGSGGMENTSVTTMYPSAVLDKAALLDKDLESLIAHELCHQWTGDMYTCKEWAHLWLNEGWATFGSALWFEYRDGEDGYLDSMRHNFNRVSLRDKAGQGLPMVSPVYEHPRETFRRAANPYPKGASIIHMLRRMMGDETFFEGVSVFMNRHALGVVETNDFRYAMEEVSGLGLEWFFEQWCYRPGVPELEINVKYDGKTRDLLIDIKQTQLIGEGSPAYQFTLPIFVRTNLGDNTYQIKVSEKETSYQTILDAPPILVAVDAYLHVLKKVKVDKPLAMWITQVNDGPTIAARHEAIAALSEIDSPETIELLAAIIRDESTRHTLRNTAIDSLADFGSDQARDELLAIAMSDIKEAKVRVTLVKQLNNFDKDKVVDFLVKTAGEDPSYATRIAAIEGLAHHEAKDHADLIADLVNFKSQHENVRKAALKALVKFDDPRGLDLAIKYAAYGNLDRARPSAIETIGKLAEHDKDKAVEVLLALLTDPERRAVRAAGSALSDVGDERAIEPIRAIYESNPNPQLRESAEKWLKKLEEDS